MGEHVLGEEEVKRAQCKRLGLSSRGTCLNPVQVKTDLLVPGVCLGSDAVCLAPRRRARGSVAPEGLWLACGRHCVFELH